MRSVKVLFFVSIEIRSVIQPLRWNSTSVDVGSARFCPQSFSTVWTFMVMWMCPVKRPFNLSTPLGKSQPRAPVPSHLPACVHSPHFAIFDSFLPQFCFLWRQHHLLFRPSWKKRLLTGPDSNQFAFLHHRFEAWNLLKCVIWHTTFWIESKPGPETQNQEASCILLAPI